MQSTILLLPTKNLFIDADNYVLIVTESFSCFKFLYTVVRYWFKYTVTVAY